MISAWHLLWIVPLVGSAGFMLAALMATAAREDERTGIRYCEERRKKDGDAYADDAGNQDIH